MRREQSTGGSGSDRFFPVLSERWEGVKTKPRELPGEQHVDPDDLHFLPFAPDTLLYSEGRGLHF